MTEIIIKQNPNSQKFEYTYSAQQQEEIERIRNKYLPKKEDKMQTLRRLDQSVEKFGTMAAIVVGLLPIIAIYPFVQKYFVKGVLIGSVKGKYYEGK